MARKCGSRHTSKSIRLTALMPDHLHSHRNGWADRIETHVLFRFTRFLTLIVISIALIAAAVGAVNYLPSLWSPSVSSGEVKAAIHREYQGQTSDTSAAVASELDAVMSLFKNSEGLDEIRKTIAGWLTAFDSDDEKIGFLRDMKDVLAYFPVADRTRAADMYRTLQFQKMKDNKARKESLLTITIAMGIAALFSLVLVLLRIERNTRTGPSNSPVQTSG